MDLIKDAFIDTGRLLPILAAVYFVVGFMEYRYGEKMRHFITHLNAWGPVAGALFGCLPQCGFSVIASALYVKRMISVGTLLSVFLSTSDEAIPVLLSMPGKADIVGLLIAVKVVIAIAAGLAIDRLIPARLQAQAEAGKVDAPGHQHADEHSGCCAHGLEGESSKFKALLLHPLMHTTKIFLFLFVLTIATNIIVEVIGSHRISSLLLNGTVLQPVLASMIGMIPNCFASVLLADLFAKGAISFGSMVAGLCAGAGLGLLVLVKENRDRADTLRVIGLLLTISISVGILLQWVVHI